MWKLIFARIVDNTASVQISFSREDNVILYTGKTEVEKIIIAGEEKTAFKIAEKFCQIWDYIW
jgi:hypothetical protein